MMFKPTIQNRAMVAFAALFVLGLVNMLLGEFLLSRINRVSETVVSTSELYKLTRRIVHTATNHGPGRDRNAPRSQALFEALDAEISRWSSADAVIATHVPEEKELGILWRAMTEDWTRLRAAYGAMRRLPEGAPDPDAALQRVEDGAKELEASISAVNYLYAKELDKLYRRMRVGILIVGPLDFLVILVVIAGLRRHVVKPLAALAETARSHTAESHAQQFEVRSDDEIGDLAAALNRSANHVQELIGQVRADADALRQAESKFRKLVENAGVGVYLVQDNRFIYVNRQFAEILGYSPDDIIRCTSAMDVVVESDQERVRGHVRRVLSGESDAGHYEFLARRPDDGTVPCEVYGTLTEYDGRPALIGTLIDLSERKRVEEQLRKLSRAIEQSPATVVITDRNGIIQYVNPKFSQLTGFTASEAIGHTPRIVQSGRTDPEVYKHLWATILAGHEWSGEILNRKKDGELFWEHMIASPVKNGDGEITHFVAVKEDITARKQAECELSRLNRTLRVLSESNQALVHAHSEAHLLGDICRNLVDLGGYRLAFVGLPESRDAARVRIAAHYGDDQGYANQWTDEDRGAGPSGIAIRGREAVIVRDISTDPHYALWRETALRCGFGSSIALPLTAEGESVGALCIYSSDMDAFGADEVRLLTELADDVAYGMVSLRARADRRRTTEALRESEERFRSISASAQDAILMFDGDGAITYWNPAAERLFGYAEAEILNQAILRKLVAPKYVSRLESGLDQFRQTGTGDLIGRTVEIEALRRSGTAFPAEVSSSAVRIGGRWNAVVMVRDVSARREAEAALNIRNRAIESSSNAIIIAKADKAEDNPIIYVNPAFERITGYTREEARGSNPRFLLGDDWDQPEIERLRDALRRSLPTQVTLRNYRKDGTLFWNELSLSPVKDDTGRLTHYISVIDDVTARVRYEEELQHRATHDELTGLANRVLLFDRIEQAIAHSSRSDRFVAVILLDLDRFKIINDSLGHGVGDLVVKTVGERLKTCVRRGDTVARLGGDEFVVVLAELGSASDASLVAWKIQDVLSYPIEVQDQQLFVTTSIGISVAPTDGNQAETLLKNADVAMYSAKEQGGSCFRFYAPGMNDRALERLSLEGDLRRAVERGEFVLHYQPKVSIATGRVIGAEALIRWCHPQRGMIPPMEFIPLAEETGLIVPIGEWALRTACQQARLWQDMGMTPVSVAVNISARQFRQPNLAKTVRLVLGETDLDPCHLELELTESMIMQNAAATINALNELKATGIKLAIDDFGTGYSSLAYLRRFPIDTLKVDRSFVRDLETSTDCRTITGTIVMLAHGLGMRVVAEGVETQEQLDMLKQSSCDEIQGYLFSKPVPEEEFRQVVRRTNGAEPVELRVVASKAR